MQARTGGSLRTEGLAASVPPYGRNERMGLPRRLFFAAVTLFALSVVGSIGACGAFFWYFFDVEPVLKVVAALLGGFVVSSVLLFWHYQRQESYTTFESIFSGSLRCCSSSEDSLWNRTTPVRETLGQERVEGCSPKLARIPRNRGAP
jgi:hypothetical protein